MQFRGWGINMMMTLAKSVHDLFKPDVPGARAEAARRLLYLFGSTAALTGVNGLPSDPMRVGLALTGAMGITHFNWGDVQTAMRKGLMEATGSSGITNLVMNGALGSMGPFSFFGADRVGFGSLAVYGEPDTYSGADISKWLFSIIGGAPFGMFPTIGSVVQDVKDGDIAKAVSDGVPFKAVDDLAKAYKGFRYGAPTAGGVPGMAPFSPIEAFMQGIGLKPERAEEWGEARHALYREQQGERDETKQLLNALGTSTEGPSRMNAMRQISAYNSQHPDAKISHSDMIKALKRPTAQSILGQTVTKRNVGKLKELAPAYGF
jgi:hypothetical protein